MKRTVYAGLSLTLCLAFTLPVVAQQPAAAAQTPAQLACDAKYRAYYAKQDDMKLFDEFANDATCKDSQYRESGYQLMANKLLSNAKTAADLKGVMDFSVRFGKDIPNATAAGKLYVNRVGMGAAAQTGDADKIVEYGEKVLAQDANDLNALIFLVATIPDKLPSEDAAREKALSRALELAKKLIAMKRVEQVDEKTWMMSVVEPAHATSGFVYLQRAAYADSAAEYEQALKINPKDQMSWYRLGLDEYNITLAAQKPFLGSVEDLNATIKAVNAITVAGPDRDAAMAKKDEAQAKKDAAEKDVTAKRDKAIDSLAAAVALGGPVADAAHKNLDPLWKSFHNNTLDGLNEFVEKHKQ